MFSEMSIGRNIVHHFETCFRHCEWLLIERKSRSKIFNIKDSKTKRERNKIKMQIERKKKIQRAINSEMKNIELKDKNAKIKQYRNRKRAQDKKIHVEKEKWKV